MLQRMRATPELKDVPVVIISGFGFEWEAELMGAQGYIGKALRSAGAGGDHRQPAPAAAGHFPVKSGESRWRSYVPEGPLLGAERRDPFIEDVGELLVVREPRLARLRKQHGLAEHGDHRAFAPQVRLSSARAVRQAENERRHHHRTRFQCQLPGPGWAGKSAYGSSVLLRVPSG